MITETKAKAAEIRFRCPHCQKFYSTGADAFEGATPEFDCISCTKTFILTSEINSFGLYETKMTAQNAFEPCPKCSSLKPYKTDECPTCGVFGSKYLELQKAESPLLYELNKQWQRVVEQFDVDHAHQDFLNKCHQNLALNFAFQKYSELQKSLGFDALCEKYIKQIELRFDQQLRSPQFNPDVTPLAKVEKQTNFSQMFFLGMGAFGMIMLIYNKFVPTFPNFNGLVLMLTVLAFGIGLFSNSNQISSNRLR